MTTCIECGNEFEALGRVLTCGDDCRRERKLRYNRERNHELYANDPEHRERAQAYGRERYASNADVRERQCKKARERYANDPAYRKQQSERHARWRAKRRYMSEGADNDATTTASQD